MLPTPSRHWSLWLTHPHNADAAGLACCTPGGLLSNKGPPSSKVQLLHGGRTLGCTPLLALPLSGSAGCLRSRWGGAAPCAGSSKPSHSAESARDLKHAVLWLRPSVCAPQPWPVPPSVGELRPRPPPAPRLLPALVVAPLPPPDHPREEERNEAPSCTRTQEAWVPWVREHAS